MPCAERNGIEEKESMGVDSRLSLEFFPGRVGSLVWRFRVRFAFETWKTKVVFSQLCFGV
jgi:hypothetical protein